MSAPRSEWVSYSGPLVLLVVLVGGAVFLTGAGDQPRSLQTAASSSRPDALWVTMTTTPKGPSVRTTITMSSAPEETDSPQVARSLPNGPTAKETQRPAAEGSANLSSDHPTTQPVVVAEPVAIASRSAVAEVTATEDFTFGPMPSWGTLPRNVFVESSPASPALSMGATTVVPEPTACFPVNGSTFIPSTIAGCLKEHIRIDRRTPAAMAAAMLRRPRSITQTRILNNRGCTSAKLASLTGHQGMLLWVTPSNQTAEVLDAAEATYHYHEHLLRVFRRPSFLARWNRLKKDGVFTDVKGGEDSQSRRIRDEYFTGLTTRTNNSRWKSADGFPLILQFSDFATEDGDSCSFGCYSEDGVKGTSYTVWDPYFAYSGEFPHRQSSVASFSKYAVEVFGPSWSQDKVLSSPDPEGGAMLAARVQKALSFLPPWEQRKPALYFRGNPNDRLRENIGGSARFKPLIRNARNTDIVVKYYYRGNPKAAHNIGRTIVFEPFQDSYKCKAVLSLRGKNAALRDRMLLMTGASLFRIMNLDKEPCMTYHDLLHPFVHYVPIVFRSLSRKLQRFQVGHLAKLDSVLEMLFRNSTFEPLLRVVAENNLRVAALIGSEEFRDMILEEVVFLYLMVLDAVPDGPSAAPTTREGALRLAAKIRIPADLHLAANGNTTATI